MLDQFPMLTGISNDSVGNIAIVDVLKRRGRLDVKIVANSLTEENTGLLQEVKLDALLNRCIDDDATTAFDYVLRVSGRLDET